MQNARLMASGHGNRAKCNEKWAFWLMLTELGNIPQRNHHLPSRLGEYTQLSVRLSIWWRGSERIDVCGCGDARSCVGERMRAQLLAEARREAGCGVGGVARMVADSHAKRVERERKLYFKCVVVAVVRC